MQEVEFEEDKSYQTFTESQQAANSRPSMMVKFLLGLGVTDTTVANYILLGVVGLFFGVTIFLYAGVFGSKDTTTIDYFQSSQQQ